MRTIQKRLIEPRVLSAPKAAAYIGRSASWFRDHLPELRESGFPAKLPILGGYDRVAIDEWLDKIGKRSVGTRAVTKRGSWTGKF